MRVNADAAPRCSCFLEVGKVVISPKSSRNRILTALPGADRDLLGPHLEFVGLDVHQVLEKPGDLISHVYFIESGLVSIVGIAKPNHHIEVGMIGYEGMTGFGVVLGNNRSANELLVQSAGSALRVSTLALHKIMESSQSLTSTLLNYVHTFMVQRSQTALANGRGRLDERLARWLLMWHDRIRNDEFPITHEVLALMLGVRRAGITIALHEFEGRGLIRSLRGRVRIVDRPGLQRAANGFYGIPEAEYDLDGQRPGKGQ
jgi:CRP-like cAMP-binding protein